MESEFNSLSRGNFTVHSARLKLHRVTVEELEKMERGVEEAAMLLADAHVDIIAYGCTSGSLFRGLGHDLRIAKSITEKTGLPAVATASCVVDALRFLKVRTVSIATPYVDEINNLERKFLFENGFEVLQMRGLGIEDNLTIGRILDQSIIELARKANHQRAQAIFISCTNLPTIDIIPQLEENVGKPVISSNTATFWSMLRKMHQDYNRIDCGRLFKS
jgi:maleate isomerase